MSVPDDPRLYRAGCGALLPVEAVHENPWFRVVNRGGYFTTEYAEAQCVILPVVERLAVVMVKVKRPVIADETWELPAGGLHLESESPAEGAARELREESGIAVADTRRFRPLPPLSTAPNRNPRLTHVFQLDLSRKEFDSRTPHDDEVHDVRCIPLEEARDMILDGRIYVTMPVALIGHYLMARGAI